MHTYMYTYIHTYTQLKDTPGLKGFPGNLTPPFIASLVLLLGFLFCVPLVTFRLIYQNKPRGSTEDAGGHPPPTQKMFCCLFCCMY
jgi:hypothetical protein